VAAFLTLLYNNAKRKGQTTFLTVENGEVIISNIDFKYEVKEHLNFFFPEWERAGILLPIQIFFFSVDYIYDK